jgi:hypothetical protein
MPQSNREMKKNKKSPHCQNISKISIKKSQNDAKLIPLSRNYMTAHLPDLVQTMVQRYNNTIKLTTTIYNIYTN